MRSLLRTINVTTAAVFVSLLTLEGVAQPSQPFELDWASPRTCPQRAEVLEQLHAMLGASPGSNLPNGLHARGVIESIEERFRLTLSVRFGQIERSRIIVSDDCTSLGKAASVVLGLLIRREREAERGLSDNDLGDGFESSDLSREPDAPETQPELPQPVAPMRPKDSGVTAQTPDASNQRQWHLLVMVPTLTVDYLTLPNVGYGFGIAAGVVHNDWRVFLSGTLWRSQRLPHGGIEPYEATFTRKSFEAWVCRGWKLSAFELSPCALIAVDIVNAGASGGRFTTESQKTVLASAGVGFMGFWHLSRRIGLFLSASGRLEAHRPVFQVDGILGVDKTHTTPWGTTLTSIGSEWIF